MSWETDTTYIARVRARSSEPDAFAARWRLLNALSASDLHPAGLPPSAIVFIRKLRDPSPRPWRLSSQEIQMPQAWQHSVSDLIAQVTHRAFRPAFAKVPPSAEAVVFFDRAELLACLASDWCNRALPQRWWWQSVLHGNFALAAVLRHWFTAIEQVPAALALLAEKRQAADWIRALDEQKARGLREALLLAFGLRECKERLTDALTGEAARSGVASLAAPFAATPDERLASVAPPVSAQATPWRRWVRETDEVVGLENQTLLAIGLLLVRAPTVARSRAFAEALADWARRTLHAQFSTPDNQARAEEAVRLHQAESPTDERGASSLSEERFDETTKSAATPSASQPASTPSDQTAIASQSDVSREANDAEEVTPQGRRVSFNEKTGSQPAMANEEPAGIGTPDGPRHGEEAGQDRAEREGTIINGFDQLADFTGADEAAYLASLVQVETRLGGIFYLINLGLFLNLYNDFTSPLRRGLELPIWDFLALVGAELIGDEWQSDPLRGLLAELAERGEEEEPGAGFEAPEGWRVPAEWLNGLPPAAVWRWNVADGRLLIEHGENFLLLDMPAQPSRLKEQLREAVNHYSHNARARLRRDKSLQPCANAFGVQRWLQWLMPYVRVRLCRALGMSDVQAMGDLLCRQRARVAVTTTHLDVVFSLAELPVAIRLSGLDRNPGWVPAAGRFVTFHFKSGDENGLPIPVSLVRC